MEHTSATISVGPTEINSRDFHRHEQEDGCSPEERKPSNLLSIHRAALSRLLRPTRKRHPSQDSVEALQQQLADLKRRRMILASEMDQYSGQELSTTVTKELEGMQDHCPPPYVHSYDTNKVDIPKEAVQHANLALRMNALRNQRRIVGSHRLAGISLLPRQEDNTLGIRMDISVNGRYVARHVVFFRIMAIKNQLFLRLAQHTLPKGVVSKSNMSLELRNKQLEDGTVMDRLREWVGELYDACYAHAVRKVSCQWLSTKANNKDGKISIECVKFNDTYDIVSFRVVLQSPDHYPAHNQPRATGVEMQLCYTNPFAASPTQVKVRRIKLPLRDERERDRGDNMERQNNSVPEVSDDDDDDDDELGDSFERIKNTFMLVSIPESVEAAMQSLETMLD